MTSLHPFSDYVNATVPQERLPDISDQCGAVLAEAGAAPLSPGLWALGDSGTVKLQARFRVGFLGVSGAALAHLRGLGLLERLLWPLAEGEHSVSRLDVAVDVPKDAPAVLKRLYRKALRGEVSLTRKAVPGTQVRRVQRAAVVDGRDTGTVYLGDRGRRVRARVYDKRDELLCRIGCEHGMDPAIIALNDPGPLTRYEVELGRKVGATLRDVCEPTAIFWHHVRGLLRVPAGVPPWEPHGEGFSVPRVDRTAYEQLELLLERGAGIHECVKAADRLGSHGRRTLLRLVWQLAPTPREAVPLTPV